MCTSRLACLAAAVLTFTVLGIAVATLAQDDPADAADNAAAAEDADGETAALLSEMIEMLGAEDADTVANARETLLAMARWQDWDVEPALQAAVESPDFERAFQARQILMELGLPILGDDYVSPDPEAGADVAENAPQTAPGDRPVTLGDLLGIPGRVPLPPEPAVGVYATWAVGGIGAGSGAEVRETWAVAAIDRAQGWVWLEVRTILVSEIVMLWKVSLSDGTLAGAWVVTPESWRQALQPGTGPDVERPPAAGDPESVTTRAGTFACHARREEIRPPSATAGRMERRVWVSDAVPFSGIVRITEDGRPVRDLIAVGADYTPTVTPADAEE